VLTCSGLNICLISTYLKAESAPMKNVVYDKLLVIINIKHTNIKN